jgi:hypothetical protein
MKPYFCDKHLIQNFTLIQFWHRRLIKRKIKYLYDTPRSNEKLMHFFRCKVRTKQFFIRTKKVYIISLLLQMNKMTKVISKGVWSFDTYTKFRLLSKLILTLQPQLPEIYILRWADSLLCEELKTLSRSVVVPFL